MNLHPTYKLLRHLETAGLQWPHVEADLLRPECVTPVQGHDGRCKFAGQHYQGYGYPSATDPGTWILIAVRRRERAECPDERQVVGREVTRSMHRTHGGSGRRWPSTWEELAERIRATGCTVESGGKHLIVKRGMEMVDALPRTSSDHRALLNACQQLRRRGVDVSR